MLEPNKQYAYFTITGDFDPGVISNLVNIKPTECWLKGDIRTQLERTFSRWSLYSRLDRICPLEAHIEDVLEQLDKDENEFVAVSLHYRAFMQLVAYFNTDYAGLHLEQRLIQSMAKYSLAVDFDFYYLYSDKHVDS
jgi:hypothetical protein